MRFSSVLSALSIGSCAYASLYAPPTEDNQVSKRSDHGYAPDLQVVASTLTSKWVEGSTYTQILEFVIVNNHDSNYLTKADTLSVTIDSNSLDLVQGATLERLGPHQSAIVQVGVKNKDGVAAGSTCDVTVVATYGQNYGTPIVRTQSISGPCGIGDYSADFGSLSHHWSPEWYNNAKFGIFIHWGIYSSPAYGNTGSNEDYAEWYWCRMHYTDYKSQTYQYHEQTYGQNFNYDDFLSNFTAENYDPVSWVNLFAEAGARYMVPVMKHHDGFNMYNTKHSGRSAVNYGPKRDLYGDLMSAAKQYQPQLKRGTYFTMPEWYHPAYAKYRNSVDSWSGAELQYTGYEGGVDDYVVDYQLPQMEELAYDIGTDIMWCDIAGTPNNSTIFASKWFNWARDNGRQVAINSRCGYDGDFSTPEYVTNGGIVAAKWESNRGMDPFSFGYNYQTPDSGYLNGNDIVQSLVDIVSKNGNFLLDIGPDHLGNIPQIMQTGLKDAGSWITTHGESIFDTRFFSQTPGEGNYRYTTKEDAFYIHYLTQPVSTLSIPDPVPWLPGDTVTVVGGSQAGRTVNAEKQGSNLVLSLDDDIINGDKYVWTFKITYTSDW